MQLSLVADVKFKWCHVYADSYCLFGPIRPFVILQAHFGKINTHKIYRETFLFYKCVPSKKLHFFL